MKSTHKALLLTLCAALLVAASVFGTLAYLTSTDEVVNTFTVGKVELKLDEAAVKEDGTYADAEKGHDARVDGNDYHLLPGHTYIKDPTVTVIKDSEDAYVRMIVEVKNIDQLMKALPQVETIVGEDGTTTQVAFPENQKYYGDNDVFLLQMLCVDENGICTWDADTWKMQENYTGRKEADGSITGIYEFRYKEIVTEESGTTDEDGNTVLPDLFTHITVPGEIDGDHLSYLDKVEIVVTAHAIQADGFENNEDLAWRKFDDPNAR